MSYLFQIFEKSIQKVERLLYRNYFLPNNFFHHISG